MRRVRALKGAVSAQKAHQGCKTETRELLGGTEEKRTSLNRVIDLPSKQINDFIPDAPPQHLIACDPSDNK